MKRPLRIVSRNTSKNPPEFGLGIRIALYQEEGLVRTNSAVEAKLDRMEEVVALAAAYQCHVCVFPEKYNTGYAITLGQCYELAEPIDGRSVSRTRAIAKSNQIATILPYPEVDKSSDKVRYYDLIAVIDSGGAMLSN